MYLRVTQQALRYKYKEDNMQDPRWYLINYPLPDCYNFPKCGHMPFVACSEQDQYIPSIDVN